MNKIDFAHNWNNKLENFIFTTIRKYTPEKQQYYFDLVGKDLEVHLQGVRRANATLIGVWVKNFQDLLKEEILLRLDTGLTDSFDITLLFRKFGIENDEDVLVLLFKKCSL